MGTTCLRWTGPARVAGRRTLGVPADCGCSSTCSRSSGRCCSCGWRPRSPEFRPARSGSFSPGSSAISISATVVVSVLYACTRRLLPLGALLEPLARLPRRGAVAVQARRWARGLSRRSSSGSASCARRTTPRTHRRPPRSSSSLLPRSTSTTRSRAVTPSASVPTRYSLGTQLRLSREELDRLNWAALLHDIGKLEVSTEIAQQPGQADGPASGRS